MDTESLRLVDVRQRFGDRVRELRSAQGYSQESFAAECDLHRTYVGGIETGRRNVSLVNIEKIAKALGVPIRELFPEGAARKRKTGRR